MKLHAAVLQGNASEIVAEFDALCDGCARAGWRLEIDQVTSSATEARITVIVFYRRYRSAVA